MGKLAHEEVPRNQEVRLVLSGEERAATSVSFVYSQDGEQVSGVELHFAAGVPEQVVHTPKLRPGIYDLGIRLGYRDGHVEHAARSLTVPSEGAARIRFRGEP